MKIRVINQVDIHAKFRESFWEERKPTYGKQSGRFITGQSRNTCYRQRVALSRESREIHSGSWCGSRRSAVTPGTCTTNLESPSSTSFSSHCRRPPWIVFTIVPEVKDRINCRVFTLTNHTAHLTNQLTKRLRHKRIHPTTMAILQPQSNNNRDSISFSRCLSEINKIHNSRSIANQSWKSVATPQQQSRLAKSQPHHQQQI